MVCFSRPTAPTLELSPNQINYIKRNARSAFDEFLIHWEPLIHIFANKQRHFRTDHEDLCQVGRLALYTAMQTYQPGKSAFCTYATKVIRNAMRDHGAPRLVYGVSLISNLADYLLGMDRAPKYILKPNAAEISTERISKWWLERWASTRASKPEVLEQIGMHTLIYPVHHGARVKLPASLEDEPLLFDEQ